MLFLSSRIGECMKCLLKIFGILTINEIVPYREHPNPKFAYVYYGKGWHTVPIEDIKYCNEILVQRCLNNSEKQCLIFVTGQGGGRRQCGGIVD